MWAEKITQTKPVCILIGWVDDTNPCSIDTINMVPSKSIENKPKKN